MDGQNIESLSLVQRVQPANTLSISRNYRSLTAGQAEAGNASVSESLLAYQYPKTTSKSARFRLLRDTLERVSSYRLCGIGHVDDVSPVCGFLAEQEMACLDTCRRSWMRCLSSAVGLLCFSRLRVSARLRTFGLAIDGYPGLLTWSEIWCDVDNSKRFRSSRDGRVSPGHRLEGGSALHNSLASIFTAPGVTTWIDTSGNTRKNQVTRLVTLRHRSTMSGVLVSGPAGLHFEERS
jgi:hypothetical protein